LNRKSALTILLTMLMVSICFIPVASAVPNNFLLSGTQTNNLHQLSGSIPIALVAGLQGNPSDCLSQPTRLEIYNYIKDNPGIHFRGICDSLGLSVGVVQYHLSVLENAGLIVSYADGQNLRYFESGMYTNSQMKLISLMRHETTAQILTILAQKGSALHKDVACELGLSSQALTWQMNHLKEAGLISAQKEGINVRYSLNDENAKMAILNLTKN
jgi:predicted transcriptional regulator